MDEPTNNHTIRPRMGLSISCGESRTSWPSPRSSHNHSPTFRPRGNQNRNKHLSPQAPSLVESYPPITLVLVHPVANDVFIINNDQNITFLGHTGPLIIVWALRPLSIITIHYLKCGFKTQGVTSPPPYLGIVLNAYTKQRSKSQIYSKSCGYSTCMAPSCSQVASSRPQQVH